MDTGREKLEMLLKRYSRIVPDGFAVDIRDHEAWDEVLKQTGIRSGYDFMAEWLCRAYYEKYGEEFLFHEKCVSYEIEYHIDAYMTLKGHKGYIPHVSVHLMPKGYLERNCEEINISVNDVGNVKQETMFHYRKGIREIYRNTEKDPYRE